MPVMDPNRCEDSGEMYSPDEQGEYTLLDETPQIFQCRGCPTHWQMLGKGWGTPQWKNQPAVGSDNTTYLFFYDKQGHQGLELDAADAIRIHMEEAFLEWISHSAHFNISCLPLMEVWWWSVTASNH